jgi:DNA-binding NarL/FixJ family response regulator
MPTTLAIVDDNPRLIQSLKQTLSFFEELEILFTASDGLDLLEKLKQHPLPQVILMDIEMPSMNGIQATYEVTQRYNGQVKIVMLTVLDQESKLFDAIQAGALGYLMKDEKPARIASAIEEVQQGGVPMSMSIARKTLEIMRKQPPMVEQEPAVVSPETFNLSNREMEILVEIAAGLSYKQVAEKLFISDKTVKKHTENIYAKLHIHSKYEAIRLAQRHNWIK